MLKCNPVTGQKGECFAVGRGAVGIYLALKEIKKKTGKVLVPANICYAAIFPIICAGYNPVFCDVDRYSGNVTLDTIKKVIDCEIIAVIVPHMYGNPVKELLEIAEYLKKNNIMLLEDCAALMVNDGSEYIPGTVGDYVVYSTGYSKTIDIGFGGLLFSSKHTLKEAEKREISLPPFDNSFEKDYLLFSKIYRLIRNEKHKSNMTNDFYMSLQKSFKDDFIYSIDDNKKDKIFLSINNLDNIIKKRRMQYLMYKDCLKNVKYTIYPYDKYAVPWRFNLYVYKDKKRFIEYCLEKKLPISDWYPCIADMFGDYNIYENALWHETHIVNFPLMIADDKVNEICKIVAKYDGELK